MALSNEMLEAIRRQSAERLDEVCDLAVRICNVPAPTGQEQERARFVAELLRERGYEPEIDEVSNVYARRGNRGGPVMLVDAHLDTVFPAGTEIDARREGDWLYGPGVGDNSLSIAAMLVMLDILDDLGIETAIDLVATATVGEEGLGNLKGARAAVDRYQERGELAGHLVIDGHLGRVVHVAVGSNRWNVTVTGPGGHSFGAFGTPSAIHGLGRIIAAIADLEVPSDPKTTFNVGTISGGTSVNTIAASATALIDMRSVDAGELEKLSNAVREIIETAPGPGLETEIEVVGERPAGSMPKDAPFAQLAAEAIRWVGLTPEFQASSTNMNIPVSRGIPTICVGISHGERTHTIHEQVPVAPIPAGLAQLTRLAIEAAEMLSRE
ncbi:MAG TPA: M20/M25/M40 family metallo-hydrolase [Thermomicrobiales bacterium]|nr:M20/M25/M40 family metallo-hydrolase [Thermomicrobiales bacterium]